MFCDLNIAKKYQLGTDKLRYLVSIGLGPHFKNILMDSTKKSYFIISS